MVLLHLYTKRPTTHIGGMAVEDLFAWNHPSFQPPPANANLLPPILMPLL